MEGRLNSGWRVRQSNLLRAGMATFEQDLHYGAEIAKSVHKTAKHKSSEMSFYNCQCQTEGAHHIAYGKHVVAWSTR